MASGKNLFKLAGSKSIYPRFRLRSDQYLELFSPVVNSVNASPAFRSPETNLTL